MRLRDAILIGTAISIGSSGVARADFSFGVYAGAGHLRFDDLEDFWDDFALTHDTDDLGPAWEVDATWQVAPRHGAVLSIGRIASSTSLHVFSELDPSNAMFAELDLKTVPVCLSYEFTVRESSGGARTAVGAGAGYYMSEIETEETFSYLDSGPVVETRSTTREGNGYGFHGYLRQTAPISAHLSLAATVRGRWVDAMAFEDDDGSIPADFTDFDFAIGLEWEI